MQKILIQVGGNLDFMLRLIQRRSGLALTREKKYLLESRFLVVGSTESIMDNARLAQPDGMRGIYRRVEAAEYSQPAAKRHSV